MDCQFISIYGKFVASQTASFSREDINSRVSQLTVFYVPWLTETREFRGQTLVLLYYFWEKQGYVGISRVCRYFKGMYYIEY